MVAAAALPGVRCVTSDDRIKLKSECIRPKLNKTCHGSLPKAFLFIVYKIILPMRNSSKQCQKLWPLLLLLVALLLL